MLQDCKGIESGNDYKLFRAENIILGIQGLLLELARVFEGFPSCNRPHCVPTFLPLYPETSSASKVQNREEIKRINGLSVFIGATEQQIQSKERADKFKDSVSPSRHDSDRKTWYKHIRSSTKRKPVRQGPIFSKKGKEVVFNFQHFVEPEQIIEDYVRANIYNKPRLVKIDKKETQTSTSPEDRITSDVDFHRCKLKQHFKCKKAQLHTDVVERRAPRWKLNKSTESVSRKGRKPTRVTATHNFVYEFNPFGNPKSSSKSSAPAGSQSSSNIGQGDFSGNGRAHLSSTAVLPKLQSRCDSAPNKFEKLEDVTNYNKSTNLPNIKQQGRTEGLAMDRDERRKRNPVSEIDREVEKVKSDWHSLRAGNRWAKGKNFISGTRSKKLYDTLDKMSREIDRIQRSYMDPKSNQHLQRSANKALIAPRSLYEEKVDEIREVLFPKGSPYEKLTDKRIVDEISNGAPSSALKSIHTDKQFEMRSLLSNTSTKNVKDALKSSGLSMNFRKGTRGNRKQMSSDIEQYLENYISDAERNFVNNEESERKELFSSPEDLARMMEKLNVQSFDFYDMDRDYEEHSPLGEDSLPGVRIENRNVKDCSRIRSIGVESSIMDVKTESGKASKEPDTENLFARKDDRLVRDSNASCFDTSIQTGTTPTLRENAFIEMGMHTSSTGLPRNVLSRVLQSDYLKKDASLKPM